MNQQNRRIVRLTVLYGLALLLAACRGAAQPPPALTQASSSTGGASAYYDLLDGDTGVPQLGALDAVESVPTRADWDKLVSLASSGGLLALTDAGRTDLLAGSMKAFLKATSTVTLDVQVAGENRGTVQERYAADADGFFTELIARRSQMLATTMPWAGAPYDDAAAPDEQRLFFDLTDPANIGVQDWSRHGALWSCSGESGDGYDSIRLAYVANLLAVPHGVPGTPNRDGSYQISVVRGKSTMIYWLDPTTLWPVRVDYPATSASPASTVRISTSSQFSILPPMQDGGCSHPGDGR